MRIYAAMELIQIYQCFCEPIRLRIVNLLAQGPLCVCHFQDVLQLPQTKVSQHLAYLRKREMVETTRKGTWIIYSLPAKPSRELEANLKCLQDCVTSDRLFHDDLARLAEVTKCTGWVQEAVSQKSCC
jgi:DNA-binding transcriptional ArsR family regulator